jgi:hypothetical protein
MPAVNVKLEGVKVPPPPPSERLTVTGELGVPFKPTVKAEEATPVAPEVGPVHVIAVAEAAVSLIYPIPGTRNCPERVSLI